jgi:pimeloyl-ACP methyl ester carboxylesterase
VLETPRTHPCRTGVVLLYPGVQEYIRAHWAFRSLATALAGRGFPVLRFDYRGVGDSAGEPESTTFEACVEDACAAARELHECASVENVAFIGMRLGAAVALEASGRLPYVDRVLLWNPIARGHDYLAELERIDRAARIRLLHSMRHDPEELGGYAFPRTVRRSIERIDLRWPLPGRARRFEIFAESVSAARCASCDRLRPPSPGDTAPACIVCVALSRSGHRVLPHHVSDSGDLPAFPDAALLAQAAVAALVSHTAEPEP